MAASDQNVGTFAVSRINDPDIWDENAIFDEILDTDDYCQCDRCAREMGLYGD